MKSLINIRYFLFEIKFLKFSIFPFSARAGMFFIVVFKIYPDSNDSRYP